MKAFIIDRPFEAETRDVPDVIPGDDEILIEVKAAGICGTDVHIYRGEYFGEYPRICGHEFSGTVSRVGKNTKHFTEGMRVSADPNIFCENCLRCKENRQNFCLDFQASGVTRDGAFARYLAIPEKCVFDIGELSFKAASMVEPLACVVHGQDNAPIKLGSTLLILGGGPIGLMHLQMAKINGAHRIDVVDPVEEKLNMALTLGADRVYMPGEATEGFYDMVIDCTGIPKVVETSLKYLDHGGTALFFGVCPDKSSISVNPYEIFKRELKIVGSFALKKTFGRALSLALSKKIQLECLADLELGLDDLPGYFETISQGGSRGLKTIVVP